MATTIPAALLEDLDRISTTASSLRAALAGLPAGMIPDDAGGRAEIRARINQLVADYAALLERVDPITRAIPLDTARA